MKIKVSATSNTVYVHNTGTERIPISYSASLGVRDFETIDEALHMLRNETGENEFVVCFSNKEMVEIEIYNNYREQ